ncbi:WYL domain-containing protein [Cohnella herbarum]|uniref:WYL domain-containing protein n=1 Tax=Cohnella herbarum TaxID=2728023 RepID=UPI0035C25D6D
MPQVKCHTVLSSPHTLILKGKQWYLKAYCLEKEQFRLFKSGHEEISSKFSPP